MWFREQWRTLLLQGGFLASKNGFVKLAGWNPDTPDNGEAEFALDRHGFLVSL
jgi:hypothetical protein